jgi:type VI protein secretion system component Hcp
MSLEAFLKIEGPLVEAEGQKEKFEKWFDVLSFSWGAHNVGGGHTGTGSGTGQGDAQDLSVMVMMQTGTHLLLKHCAFGEHFDKATLIARETGGKEQVNYLELEMEKVLISSWQFGASEGGGKPPVNISLNFKKVKFIYRPQDDKGKALPDKEVTWDISKGKDS